MPLPNYCCWCCSRHIVHLGWRRKRRCTAAGREPGRSSFPCRQARCQQQVLRHWPRPPPWSRRGCPAQHRNAAPARCPAGAVPVIHLLNRNVDCLLPRLARTSVNAGIGSANHVRRAGLLGIDQRGSPTLAASDTSGPLWKFSMTLPTFPANRDWRSPPCLGQRFCGVALGTGCFSAIQPLLGIAGPLFQRIRVRMRS